MARRVARFSPYKTIGCPISRGFCEKWGIIPQPSGASVRGSQLSQGRERWGTPFIADTKNKARMQDLATDVRLRMQLYIASTDLART